MSSWERGYGDFEMKPDFDTLRPVPWHEGTALVLADLAWSDDSPVVASPRQILRAPARPRSPSAAGRPTRGTELEFMVFRDTYEEAWHKALPRPRARPTTTTSTTRCSGTARVEPLVRRIRNEMAAAGMNVENAKGECNFGQHEINFLYGAGAADRRRPRDLQEGRQGDRRTRRACAITYMAKFDEREGNSCHIHLSLPRQRRQLGVRDDALPRAASSPACAS